MIAESYCVKPPTPACSDLDLLAEDGDDHHDSRVCFACYRRERRDSETGAGELCRAPGELVR